jgi:hypothetical protein
MLEKLKLWYSYTVLFFKTLTFGVLCVICYFGINGFINPRVKVQVEKIPVEVEAPEMTVAQMIDEAPRLGMPKVVAAILLDQEDGGRNRKNAKRCEWDSKEWLNRATKIEPNDKEQRDAYRCSYGAFQVAGWHAPEYGLVWSDLLNPRNNLEVCAAVWGKCKEQADKKLAGRDLYAIYRDSFRCYNGSGLDAENYADRAMSKLERLAVNKFLKDGAGA